MASRKRKRVASKPRSGSGSGFGNKLQRSTLGPIEDVPHGSLKPYPGNARTHDERQLAKIGQSLQAFGWMNPIIADEDSVIIAGHGRWLAAGKLGLATVPVVRVR